MLTHAIILPTLKIETYGGWGGGRMEGREKQQTEETRGEGDKKGERGGDRRKVT